MRQRPKDENKGSLPAADVQPHDRFVGCLLDTTKIFILSLFLLFLSSSGHNELQRSSVSPSLTDHIRPTPSPTAMDLFTSSSADGGTGDIFATSSRGRPAGTDLFGRGGVDSSDDIFATPIRDAADDIFGPPAAARAVSGEDDMWRLGGVNDFSGGNNNDNDGGDIFGGSNNDSGGGNDGSDIFGESNNHRNSDPFAEVLRIAARQTNNRDRHPLFEVDDPFAAPAPAAMEAQQAQDSHSGSDDDSEEEDSDENSDEDSGEAAEVSFFDSPSRSRTRSPAHQATSRAHSASPRTHAAAANSTNNGSPFAFETAMPVHGRATDCAFLSNYQYVVATNFGVYLHQVGRRDRYKMVYQRNRDPDCPSAGPIQVLPLSTNSLVLSQGGVVRLWDVEQQVETSRNAMMRPYQVAHSESDGVLVCAVVDDPTHKVVCVDPRAGWRHVRQWNVPAVSRLHMARHRIFAVSHASDSMSTMMSFGARSTTMVVKETVPHKFKASTTGRSCCVLATESNTKVTLSASSVQGPEKQFSGDVTLLAKYNSSPLFSALANGKIMNETKKVECTLPPQVSPNTIAGKNEDKDDDAEAKEATEKEAAGSKDVFPTVTQLQVRGGTVVACRTAADGVTSEVLECSLQAQC